MISGKQNKNFRTCCIVMMCMLYLTGCSTIQMELCSPAVLIEDVSASSALPVENLPEGNVSDNPGIEWTFYNEEGMTLETRVNPPKGYTRPEVSEDSFARFLRNYPLKEHGSSVLLYNGEPKEDQTAHAAVFALPIETEDLQQCADSIMRIYAEYYRSTGQQNKLSFHFTEEFTADYGKWRDGYRIQFSGNQFNWIKHTEYDDSYDTFIKYLRMVFAYAGTRSMDAWESVPISLDELQVGDVFLRGDSPGHAMLVVDICYNAEGEKAFLLAQGHMPAQEFQLAKNPAHPEDPWYYENEVIYPFETIEYTFPEECLQRLTY